MLSEIGEANSIKVTDDEMARALSAQASRFPGQEQHVYKFFRENPQQLLSIRAPIYEEKVVSHILEKVKLEDKPIPAEELFKSLVDENQDAYAGHSHAGVGHDHDHDHHDHDHDHGHNHDHGHDHGHHPHDHKHDHDHGDHGHDHGHKHDHK